MQGKITHEVIEIKRILFCIILLIPPSVHAEGDYDFLLPTIRACADIVSYDSNTDINELMLRILYTNENFDIITPTKALRKAEGGIKMCSGEFIDDVLHRVFRKAPPRPEAHELTRLGYCYHDGYYYYYGGYTKYFATDVKTIDRVIELNDGSIYTLVTNTYTEGAIATEETSAITFLKDREGYYVTEIDMSLDYLSIEDSLSPAPSKSLWVAVKPHLPMLVAIITLALVFWVFYKYLLS